MTPYGGGSRRSGSALLLILLVLAGLTAVVGLGLLWLWLFGSEAATRM